MIKVLFITHHLPMPNEPGAFRPWMEAKLLRKAGYDVTVITSGTHYMTGNNNRHHSGWCSDELCEGIRILKVWAPQNHRKTLLRRTVSYSIVAFLTLVAAILKVRKVNTVFAGTGPIFLMPVVFLVSILKRASLVLDERDLYPETAYALGVIKKGYLYNLLFKMQQFFRHKAKSIVTATPGIRNRLVDYGISSNKISLLYNADVFLSEIFNYNKGYVCSNINALTDSNFLVCYAGGLGKANDVMTILKAAKELLQVKDIAFLIIGSGEYLENYKRYKFENNLKNVYFFNVMPRNTIIQVLRQVDVCIQPLHKHSHFNYTLTQKTFDYHFAGKPMIFCGSGDTANLLKQSGGGLVSRPEDEKELGRNILTLYNNKGMRNKMGKNAKEWFANNINIAKACKTVKSAIEY